MSELTKKEKGRRIIELFEEIESITRRRFSSEKLAEEIGCSATLLREVLQGKAEIISHASLDKILNGLRNY